MNTDRIEEIQKATAYPESKSVQQALLQVWNECGHELNQLRADVKLMEHKLITCGVAATHSDKELSYRKADYGGKWDSPQTQSVRLLRNRYEKAEAEVVTAKNSFIEYKGLWKNQRITLEAEVARLTVSRDQWKDACLDSNAMVQGTEHDNKVLREALEYVRWRNSDWFKLCEPAKAKIEQALKETAITQEPNDHHADLLEHLESTGTPEELEAAIEEAEDKA